jgi:hypothetical protein
MKNKREEKHVQDMIAEETIQEKQRLSFYHQFCALLKLRFILIFKQKIILFTLYLLSVTLFIVIFFMLRYTEKIKSVSIKTVDMIYKALENFIFLSISGVFLF